MECAKAARPKWPWRATAAVRAPGFDGRQTGPDAGAASTENGSAAITLFLGMLIVLAVFVGGCNFVVFEYGQGVLRAAVDQGARAGAAQPGTAQQVCQAEAAQVMHNLLPGAFGTDITITCTVSGAEVVAVAAGSFPGWLPPIPALSVHIEGTSKIEEPPTP